MSKLQGLKFLKNRFEWQVQTMTHIMLYKNLPPEKHEIHLIGLAKAQLLAKECGDILWFLGLVRNECIQGMSGIEPEGYDPYFDGEGNPPLEEARPYSAHFEMLAFVAPEETPHGLGLDLSPGLLSAVNHLLTIAETTPIEAEGHRLTRDSDEGEWRRMTTAELTREKRKNQTELMQATVFVMDFNKDMARLRQLVAERGSFAEILDLVGPEPVEEEA